MKPTLEQRLRRIEEKVGEKKSPKESIQESEQYKQHLNYWFKKFKKSIDDCVEDAEIQGIDINSQDYLLKLKNTYIAAWNVMSPRIHEIKY